jgi:hypothetical protein
MGDEEQPGSGGRDGWPVRLAAAVGAGTGAALGLLAIPFVNLGGFWPGAVAFGALVGVGAVLGRLAGSLLFRGPPGNGSGA